VALQVNPHAPPEQLAVALATAVVHAVAAPQVPLDVHDSLPLPEHIV
jgi:hypothetical protein